MKTSTIIYISVVLTLLLQLSTYIHCNNVIVKIYQDIARQKTEYMVRGQEMLLEREFLTDSIKEEFFMNYSID